MHVHLPKPLHGWRAFVGEVGIIVLGVLIALGAEQVVEAAHWREKVGVVRHSLMGELANDRARWEWNVGEVRCTMGRVDALAAWAQQEGATERPPPGPGANIFWMHSANWSLATGSGTLDHFPLEEQLAFAALYDGIAHRQMEIEKTSDLLDRVDTLTPLADDAQSRRELRVTLSALRGQFVGLLSNEGYMRRHFDALGAKPDRSDFAADLGDGKHCGH
jgi:hypothetical protein